MTQCASVHICNYAIQLRADKYSKKVYKYFVEYADKESKKKTTTESEKRISEQEAKGYRNAVGWCSNTIKAKTKIDIYIS